MSNEAAAPARTASGQGFEPREACGCPTCTWMRRLNDRAVRFRTARSREHVDREVDGPR